MAYRKPSTAIYQLLENAGGAANTTPDLEVVIVGELNNVQKVDPTDGVSLANTKSTDIDLWTDAGGEIGISAFRLPFNAKSSFPGQVVKPASVEVYLANVQVKTFEFTFDLRNNATEVDKATFVVALGLEFGDSEGDATASLPGGYGAHVQPGDIIIAENTDGIHRSIVSAVVKDPLSGIVRISMADPINYTDSVVSLSTTFSVYREFKSFKVTDLVSIDTASVNALNNPGVDLSVYAKPFPSSNRPTDYAFRSPAEDEDGEGEPISVHVGYVAQRVDTVGTILEVNGPTDLKGVLGEVNENNPLALGVSIALANTITSVRALAVESVDMVGFSQALDLLESERLYFLIPLTQDISILQSFANHAKQLSTATEALWRMVILNTAISSTKTIVEEVAGIDEMGPGTITLNDGSWMLSSDSHTFLSSGVLPGDILNITGSSNSTIRGEHKIAAVINNQVLKIEGTLAVANNIVFEVTRSLTRTQQADEVAANSAAFGSNRVVHVQPDTVGIKLNGVMKYLPGYYLACGLGGMGAGFPVQQGFTNIGVAGIDDLRHSNYYFTRSQLNTMAAKGTCLFVQDTQGGLPYCRHELTTDMSVLEYREILKVKNWDYLSYFYKDILDPFIGSWNITDDTLSAMRQSISSASENLMTKKVAKIGAPLMGYRIDKLEQNAESKDTTNIRIAVAIADPNNYMDVDLVI